MLEGRLEHMCQPRCVRVRRARGQNAEETSGQTGRLLPTLLLTLLLTLPLNLPHLSKYLSARCVLSCHMAEN